MYIFMCLFVVILEKFIFNFVKIYKLWKKDVMIIIE